MADSPKRRRLDDDSMLQELIDDEPFTPHGPPPDSDEDGLEDGVGVGSHERECDCDEYDDGAVSEAGEGDRYADAHDTGSGGGSTTFSHA